MPIEYAHLCDCFFTFSVWNVVREVFCNGVPTAFVFSYFVTFILKWSSYEDSAPGGRKLEVPLQSCLENSVQVDLGDERPG